jgi:hypothetical protein
MLIGRDVTIAPVIGGSASTGATIELQGGLGGGHRSQGISSLAGFPEYFSLGSFGGGGGYGRVTVDYTNSFNGVVSATTAATKPYANKWGMEVTGTIPSSNTWRTLAGTARYYCPGMVAGGTIGQSNWFDLASVAPIVTAASMSPPLNATATLGIQGAQSHPHTIGAGTGVVDPTNTSLGNIAVTGNTFLNVAGVPNPILQGWRFLRYRIDFVRTSPATGAPVAIDNVLVTYTTE